MKTVAIDLRMLDPNYKGGIRSFSKGLVNSLTDRVGVLLIVDIKHAEAFESMFPNCDILVHKDSIFYPFFIYASVIFSYSIRNVKAFYFIRDFFSKSLQKKIDSSGVDLVITPTTYLNNNWQGIVSVTCLHDIQERYYPENFSYIRRIWRWVHSEYTVKYSSFVQVSSTFIRDCVHEKIGGDNLVVITEGVDVSWLKRSDNESLDFYPQVLYPAGLWPHKNHKLLIDALARYKSLTGSDLEVALVGHESVHHNLKLPEYIKEKELVNVRYLGSVSDEVLASLYANCEIVLALGSHESSCIPVKEALMLEKKVICLNIPPNGEFEAFNSVILSDETAESICDSIIACFSMVSDDNDHSLIARYHWNYLVDKYLQLAK